jgi:hypothetical protein
METENTAAKLVGAKISWMLSSLALATKPPPPPSLVRLMI